MTKDVITDDIATVRWYLDKRDDPAGWFALDRLAERITRLEDKADHYRWVVEHIAEGKAHYAPGFARVVLMFDDKEGT